MAQHWQWEATSNVCTAYSCTLLRLACACFGCYPFPPLCSPYPASLLILHLFSRLTPPTASLTHSRSNSLNSPLIHLLQTFAQKSFQIGPCGSETVTVAVIGAAAFNTTVIIRTYLYMFLGIPSSLSNLDATFLKTARTCKSQKPF